MIITDGKKYIEKCIFISYVILINVAEILIN